MDLKQHIREVSDWPKLGIRFYDITTLLENAEALKYSIDKLAEPFKSQKIDKVVGIDARGFLLASAVAYILGSGVSLVRKKGKLPYKTIFRDYTLEYASNTVEMHEDTIKPGEKAILIDDLIATGGTACAAVELIEQMGGEIVGIGFLVDLPFLGGIEKLEKYKPFSLVQYYSE